MDKLNKNDSMERAYGITINGSSFTSDSSGHVVIDASKEGTFRGATLRQGDGSNGVSFKYVSNSTLTFDISSWANGTYSNCYIFADFTENTVYSSKFTVIKSGSSSSATLTVNPTSISITNTSQNDVQVNYTCDETLTNIEISFDNGTSYSAKKSMTQTNAIFDISGKGNATYNCKLRGTYTDSTPVYGNIVLDKTYVTMTSSSDTHQIGVKLDKAPTSNQVVTLTVTTGSSTAIGVQSNGTLTFNSSNWNTYQYCTVRAGYWASASGSRYYVTASSSNVSSKEIEFYRP